MTIENEAVAVSTISGHRDGAVEMFQARHAAALERNRRKLLPPPLSVDLKLNHLNLNVAANRVVRAHGAIDDAPIVEAAVHILEEVRRGQRGMLRVDLHLDRSRLWGGADPKRRFIAPYFIFKYRSGTLPPQVFI